MHEKTHSLEANPVSPDDRENTLARPQGPTQGHKDLRKSLPIFERGTEANLKMVPIYPVPIPRSRTVHCPPMILLGTLFREKVASK